MSWSTSTDIHNQAPQDEYPQGPEGDQEEGDPEEVIEEMREGNMTRC